MGETLAGWSKVCSQGEAWPLAPLLIRHLPSPAKVPGGSHSSTAGTCAVRWGKPHSATFCYTPAGCPSSAGLWAVG